MATSQSSMTLIGNVTDDPELKFTPSGAAVVNFSVAVTERVKNTATDSWEDGETSFYRCTAWRRLAEHIAESITKGTRVIVVGSLKIRGFERNDGSKGTSVEITADYCGPDLTFATAQVTRATSNGGNQQAPAQQANSGWGAQPAAQDNPWATGGQPAQPQAAFAGGDEPPF